MFTLEQHKNALHFLQLPTDREEREIALGLIPWVDALESGEYKQGKKFLRQVTDKFCCLGVACDVYKDVLPNGVWTKAYDSDNCSYYRFYPNYPSPADADPCGLPLSVVHHLNLRGTGLNLRGATMVVIPSHMWEGVSGYASTWDDDTEEHMMNMIVLNDVCDLTFLDIAACIRYTYNIPYSAKQDT